MADFARFNRLSFFRLEKNNLRRMSKLPETATKFSGEFRRRESATFFARIEKLNVENSREKRFARFVSELKFSTNTKKKAFGKIKIRLTFHFFCVEIVKKKAF